MDKWFAVLLIGPTGSGKTPLGDVMENSGAFGRHCFHFDFGANLRETSESGSPNSRFSQQEIDVIRHSLETGALLKNENFPIAAKILNRFIEIRRIERDNLIIFNGLPRHVGQADDVDKLIDIKRVISLESTPQVIIERIRQNTGGDRSDRIDDSPDAIRNKLKIFKDRTQPLLDYYQSRSIPIEHVEVGTQTKPQDILDNLRGVQI